MVSGMQKPVIGPATVAEADRFAADVRWARVDEWRDGGSSLGAVMAALGLLPLAVLAAKLATAGTIPDTSVREQEPQAANLAS
jgi:hypothetical protein